MPDAEFYSQVFIRPASMADLDHLLQLAEQAGAGLTTLPRDRQLLAKRIAKSQRSIDNIPDRPGGESYLLVMQDLASSRIVGASGIVSKVGGFEPFYAYRLESERFDCDLLKIHKQIQVLRLVREHDGPAEVGSLFLAPEYRKKDFGRFLQLVRFHFVAEHPEAFEPTIVSELRGVIDENGRSAFWDAVGRHFFEIDFPKADYLSVVNKNIADLMPRHPIYVPLLPSEAQKVIGKVHESSRPAMKNLEQEGFVFSGMVDIFDGGPCVSCARDDIRSVRESRTGTFDGIAQDFPGRDTYMIGVSVPEFRACIGPVQMVSDSVIRLDAASASILKLSPGEPVRYTPLRPGPSRNDKEDSRASD